MHYSETGRIRTVPKSFVVTSYKSIGCSFIDWSLHFLNGRNFYYSIETQSWIPLVSNPLTKNNAHGHRRNHPSGLAETKKYTEHCNQLSNNILVSMYPCPQHLDLTLADLNISTENLQDTTCFAQVQEAQYQDYVNLLNYAALNFNKVIFVGYDNDLWSSLYHVNGRASGRLQFSNCTPMDQTEIFNESQEVFYSTSVNHWNKLNLTNVWDIRERLALDMRLDKHLIFKQEDHFTFDHYWINAKDFWFNGERCVHQLLDYLELSLVDSRYNKWVKVFKVWQAIQFDNLKFSLVCKHIVDSIVLNSFYQIPELSFDQETIIQHLLIYRYNLNLKTWQLTKFPKNTQDLHKLLEPNMHQIDNTYRELLTQFY